MQPGPGQNQPQQQMMYNQQFSMGQSVPGGYAGAQNPGAMMPGGGGGGPAGMMQNTAMPQMPANGQSEFIRSLVSPARVTRSDRPKLLLCLWSPIPSLSYVQSQSRSSSMGRRVPSRSLLPPPAWPTVHSVLASTRKLPYCLIRTREGK